MRPARRPRRLADRRRDPIAPPLEWIERRIDLAAPLVAVPARPVELGAGRVKLLHRLAQRVPLVRARSLEASQITPSRLAAPRLTCQLDQHRPRSHLDHRVAAQPPQPIQTRARPTRLRTMY